MTNEQIIALIKREVVPAIGCTEPAAVALCTAHATEALGCRPDSIDVMLSANMLKNAMGVGIPGTGMSGLPIAVALGALIGKSEYRLEVLKDVCPEAVAEAKAFLAANRVSIGLTQDSDEMLNLNRTLTGINTIYEMQLRSVSQQVGTIDQINEQTRRMAAQIEELNAVYARMIEALTVNMPKV